MIVLTSGRLVLLVCTVLTSSAATQRKNSELHDLSAATSNSSSSFTDALTSPEAASDVVVTCRGLRSKRYLSDGFCRSLRPVSEVLCTGRCVTARQTALSPDYQQLWDKSTGGRAFQWRCVDADVRLQRTKLVCDNGDVRVYRVRVVKSCECSRAERRHGRKAAFHRLQDATSSTSTSSSNSSSSSSSGGGGTRRVNPGIDGPFQALRNSSHTDTWLH